MTDFGIWFLGNGGTDKIATIGAQLFDLVKKDTERALGVTFKNYVPWMSMYNARADLYPLFGKSPLPDVIVDTEILSVLARTFQDKEGPLGRVGLDEAHNDEIIYRVQDGNEESIVQMIREGRDLYLTSYATFKRRWNSVIQTIVPLEVIGSKSTNRAAFSSHFLRGAIFRAIPKTSDKFWKIDLAVDLAHELGHQALILYQAADRIINSDLAQKVYSGVRKVDRPAIMSFHAAAALVYMIEYLNVEVRLNRLSEEEVQYAEAELKNYRRDLMANIAALEKVEFSEIGRQLFMEMSKFSEMNRP